MYLIVECWTIPQSISRGFSHTPEKDILNVLKKYNCVKEKVLWENNERNIVFKVNFD